MRLSPLTTVTDDSRTMLTGGLALQRLSPLRARTNAYSVISAPPFTLTLRRLENGRTRIVAKLGREGAATLEGGQLIRRPAFPIEPLDTTGAGDALTGAGFTQDQTTNAGGMESSQYSGNGYTVNVIVSGSDGTTTIEHTADTENKGFDKTLVAMKEGMERAAKGLETSQDV